MTRALMFQAGFSNHFWGDCLLTSTYIINRIPTSVLGFISPYEKLHNTPPDYTLFRVLGCLTYMTVHTSDKLAPRALKTIFLGYPPNQKGYKLYDPITNVTHISRHVIFHETIFLFKDTSNSILYPPTSNLFMVPDTTSDTSDSYSTPIDHSFSDVLSPSSFVSSPYITSDSSSSIPYSFDNSPQNTKC